MEEKNVWERACILSPSLICLDMLHLEEQIRTLEESGIEMLHVDILDGHFSPSMPLGFEVVKQLRKITKMAFECHVMATPPDFFIEELLKIGVEEITFQIESAHHVDRLLSLIHTAGVRAGLALAPATPLSVLEYALENCDSVLLMQINPGFASHPGEGRIGYMDRKIRDLRSMIDERGLKTKIILDGRVSPQEIREYGRGLANIFVCGTTCLSQADLKGSVEKLKKVEGTTDE